MVFRFKALAFFLSLFYFMHSYAALTKIEAENRAKQFSDVHYVLGFNFSEAQHDSVKDNSASAEGALYSGRVHIAFNVTSNPSELENEFFLDFKALPNGQVSQVFINDSLETAVRWDKKEGKLYLSSGLLQLGKENTIDLTFVNNFTHQGHGVHRAVDEKDKEVYLYTKFEPYSANELFPLFDQPDLKANFEVNVEVPNHWKVVSNTRETVVKQTTQQTNTWFFPQSQKFSTYLFMLAAGPFQVWESDKGHIPLRLFARKSIADDVVPQEWFDATVASFEFYENRFGAYPFKKYDQVIVPDFSAGAMENVAAVTFTENYAHNKNMTPSVRTKLVKVIAHEMAHMWFGDLVTMKWWDDLWLNESFATFCAFYFSNQHVEQLNLVANPWQTFFDLYKTRAYSEDDYQTTHPIVGNVPDTNAANSVFDGITYGKGASALKQLAYYIGEDVFFEGAKQYLDKFRFQNATREDFISTLSKVSGVDLSDWDETWLGNQGTDKVKVIFSSQNGKISNLTLYPLPANANQKPRTHKTQVGLYGYNDHGAIVLKETIPVTYSNQPVELSEAIGKEAPVFAFANTDDYDFSQSFMDLDTFQSMSKVFGQISDENVQLQLFYSFVLMVVHSELPARDLINLILETEITDTESYVLSNFHKYLGELLKYVTVPERQIFNDKISNHLYEKFLAAEAGSSIQTYLFNWFLSFKLSEKNVAIVVHLLKDEEQKSALKVTSWNLITALAKVNYPNIKNLIEEESLLSPNHSSQLFAEMAIATSENKRFWFNELTTFGQYMTIDTRNLVNSVFHDIFNESLTEFVESDYLDMFLKLSQQNEANQKLTYLAGLYPLNSSEGFDAYAREFLSMNKDTIPFDARRKILERIEDSERMHQARTL